MSILLALIIGMGIGGAGQYFLRKEPDTLLICVISGIAGSILGLAAFVALNFNAATTTLFKLPAVLFCAMGALLGVVVFISIHTFMEKRAEAQSATGRTETESKIANNPVHKKARD